MKPRIFISCVSEEFRSLREKVAQVLAFLGYEPEFQEIWGTESGDLRQMLRQKIDDSDGLIQIVGEAYGAEPHIFESDKEAIGWMGEAHTGEDSELGECDSRDQISIATYSYTDRYSYTQFEFLYASYRKKKTWLLFAKPDSRRDTEIGKLDMPPESFTGDRELYQSERRDLQALYRERIRDFGHLKYSFHTVLEAENAVLKLRSESPDLRREFTEWQQTVSESQARIEAGQSRQVAILGSFVAFALLLLLAAGWGFSYLARSDEYTRREILEKLEAERGRLTVVPVSHGLGEATRLNTALLKEASASNTRAVVDPDNQRLYLLIDGRIALDAPVSTGGDASPTPEGIFDVVEKRNQKGSTIYSNPLPYWIGTDDPRLAIHPGSIPGYPSTKGTVRLPPEVAKIFFDAVEVGTKIQVGGLD